MMPSIGPGLCPLSASACCTCRTVLESMVDALWLMPLMLLDERFIDELLVVSPAARADADASAIQQSAAAIGVRLNLISMLL
jgi:hypothetical protein